MANDMKDQSEIDMDKDEHKRDEHEEKTNKETSLSFQIQCWRSSYNKKHKTGGKDL